MELSRLPVLLPKDEKRKFKVLAAKNNTTMSDILRDFALAYNKNPKIYNSLVSNQ